MDNRWDDAIAWHLRLRDPTATAKDWADLTDWLAADPANADAWAIVAESDAALSTALADAAPSNDNQPARPAWYQRRGLFAVAAGLALAVVAAPALLSGPSLETFSTQLGQTQEIALSDGSRIVLNGGTKVQLDVKNSRFAQLDEGEAVFTIKHDAVHPFELRSGKTTLRDLGTVFNVRTDQDGLDVAVSEGAVQFNPDAEGLTVSAGYRLQMAQDQRAPTIKPIDKMAVAGWRIGLLTYQETRLSVIATDLSRSLGTPVSVSQEIAGRPFSGSIRVERDQKLLFRRLESLLGVRAAHSGKGWQLTS